MVTTPAPDGQEHRTFQRTQLKLPLRFRVQDRPDVWHAAITSDISAAGLLMTAEMRVDVSSGVSVLLRVPGEQTPRQISGIVVRLELEPHDHHYLIGLQFTDLDEASRRHIAAAIRSTDILSLLRLAADANASDVHLAANHPPLIRVAGQLKPLRGEIIEGQDLKCMIYTVMDERQRRAFERDLELDFSLSVEPTIRYRVNIHSQRGHVEAAFRRVEPAVRTAAELNLPPITERLADLRDGLVLITGPTGSGKTTSVAAMINHINSTRAAVIIALENPIEYVYTHKLSVIKQREIGIDTHSFPAALREAMRQDPDVIVVGEVRDEETMKTALDASESGHLVLATFPAANCTDAILRVVHFFRKERQQEAQLELANCLRAIISQRLLPRADAVGVIPATEVLINTLAVANIIRSGTVEQIPSVIQTSAKQGMHSLDSSLELLCRAGLVSMDTVKQHSLNTEEILKRLEAAESGDATTNQ